MKSFDDSQRLINKVRLLNRLIGWLMILVAFTVIFQLLDLEIPWKKMQQYFQPPVTIEDF